MALDDSTSFGRTFAPVPGAPGHARTALRKLSGSIDEDVLERAILVVTELVTNSVKHAGLTPAQHIALKVSVLPELLRAEVTDDGDGFEPVVTGPEPDRGAKGWGLWLVDQLADRWGVDVNHTTSVWFELDRQAS